MTWTVSDQEFEGVLQAGAVKQYSYLVSEGVWFAVWTHARYAEVLSSA